MHAGSVRMSKGGKRGKQGCHIHFLKNLFLVCFVKVVFFSYIYIYVRIYVYKKLLLLEAVLGTVIRQAVVRTQHDSSVRITNIFKPWLQIKLCRTARVRVVVVVVNIFVVSRGTTDSCYVNSLGVVVSINTQK